MRNKNRREKIDRKKEQEEKVLRYLKVNMDQRLLCTNPPGQERLVSNFMIY